MAVARPEICREQGDLESFGHGGVNKETSKQGNRGTGEQAGILLVYLFPCLHFGYFKPKSASVLVASPMKRG